MRDDFTFHITEIEDDIKFNPSGIGYLVEIADSGLIIGDGVAITKQAAIFEALKQAGILV